MINKWETIVRVLIKSDWKPVTIEEFDKLRSPLEVVNHIYIYNYILKPFYELSDIQIPNDVNPDNVFIYNPDMFDSNGKITIQKKSQEMLTNNELTTCKAQVEDLVRKQREMEIQIQQLVSNVQVLSEENNQLQRMINTES